MVDWVLQNALWTAFLAGLLAIASQRRFFSPALRHALWVVVLIKFVTPSISMWSLPGVAEQLAPVSERISARLADDVGPNPVIDPELYSGTQLGVATTLAPIAMKQTEVKTNGRGLFVLANLVLALWLIGTMVYLLVQSTKFIRIRRKIASAKPAPSWLVDEVRVMAIRLSVPTPSVSVVSSIHSPLICGVWRTRLLWPEHMLDTKHNRGVSGIIVHELAHAARRDPWIGWLELVVTSAWWWNPVIWYVRRQLNDDAELACDAWVVDTLPNSRRDYGETLIDVYENCVGRIFVPAPAVVSGAKQSFERRLTMLMSENLQPKMSKASWLAAAVLALAVLTMGSAHNASAKPNERTANGQGVYRSTHEYLEVEVSYSASLPSHIRALAVMTTTGSVDVRTSDNGEVTIEAFVRVRKDQSDQSQLSDNFDDHVLLSAAGGVFTIESVYKPEKDESYNGSVSFRVLIPRDLAIHASTMAGDVTVSRATGTVDLSTYAGIVKLYVPDSILSGVSVRTGSGNVAINVASVDGELTAFCSVGSINCTLESGATSGNLTLQSSKGDISLVLPQDTDAGLAMATSVGSIKTDGGISLRRPPLSVMGKRASATLGDDGPLYNLSTIVGSINVSVR